MSTPARRLVRSSSDRMLTGVCGGLAEYFGVSSSFVRIAFVLFGFFGAGELAYLILWVLMRKR